MHRKNRVATLCIAGAALAVAFGSFAIAQSAREGAAPTGQPEFPLPPGWTPEDMQACMDAATPGEQQAFLAKDAGVWEGKSVMWMYPGAEPVESACTATITPVMDGRYTRCQIDGEMPGMGPFVGIGTYGYDNVAQTFVANWIDSHSTGMMNGTGELSQDKKTLTWRYTFSCPVTGKPAAMREVERFTSPNTKTLEMFGTDPKTGEEWKMMKIEFTRKTQ